MTVSAKIQCRMAGDRAVRWLVVSAAAALVWGLVRPVEAHTDAAVLSTLYSALNGKHWLGKKHWLEGGPCGNRCALFW